MHLIPDALPVFVRFPSWRSDPDIDQKWSVGTISQPDLQLQFGGSEVSQKRGFSSPARSGMLLKNRAGLKQLLKDVMDGQLEFRAVLIYDESRWGRFQD